MPRLGARSRASCAYAEQWQPASGADWNPVWQRRIERAVLVGVNGLSDWSRTYTRKRFSSRVMTRTKCSRLSM